MKDNFKVIHIPEICEYNDFINETSNIQKKVNIQIIKPNICIDGESKKGCSNNMKDIFKYMSFERNENIVVHFHWPEKLYKNVDLEIFKKDIMELKNKNIKLVKTIHNLKPHEMGSDDIKKEEFLFTNLDGVIFFSKSQLEYFKDKYNLYKNVEIIPHPNYKIVTNKIKSESKGKQYILCVPGRIRKYKQTKIIIETMELLKDYNIKVKVIGKPDDKESVQLLKKYSRINNNLHCDFRFFPMEELERHILESDATLLTHEFIWTSGIAVLSADLSVPLIGTLPKNFEEYEIKRIGYFLDSNKKMTAMHLGKLIEQAINDGRKNNQAKGNDLKRLLEKNSDEEIAKLYKKFYQQLFI